MDARELEEHVYFSAVAAALDEAVHHVHHPGCALAAGGALAARLVLVELDESREGETTSGKLMEGLHVRIERLL